MTEAPLLDPFTDLDTISGWFYASDKQMFRWFLNRQRHRGEGGDLVELGAYLGKSTALIGAYLEADETLTVVDLFGQEAADVANAEENQSSYRNLTRDSFEANYLLVHRTLPSVHTDFSSAVTGFVEPGAVRFMHVDASHLYEHVAGDVLAARSLLAENGIVSFDDYRSPHTPGVAAAVWEAVLNGGMRPVCITPMKFYATWGDPAPVVVELQTYLSMQPGVNWETQLVAGHPIVRCDFGD